MSFPKVSGVSRVADNDKAIEVIFRRPLTDDEMRVLHEEIKLLCHETLDIKLVGKLQ